MKSEAGQYKEIIFPENSSDVILKILERYGLKETNQEMIKKLSKKEKTIRGTVAELIKKIAQEEIPSKDFSPTLSERLGVSKKIADDLAKDAEKEILVFVKRIPKEEQKERIKKGLIERERTTSRTELPKKIKDELPTSTKELPSKPQIKDDYREPIE